MSVLYLAAAAGFADLVRRIMENPLGRSRVEEKQKIWYPVHAALHGRNIGILSLICFLFMLPGPFFIY